MRFTRLRLNGFKSFVDPTDLVISEGLTGVVGPNGCGKSNLLEALRWVMGENRPTAMRGGGMEDVIFAGASTRPARNYAEVSLTIDNSERLAPSGFNDSDTLEIVRRITRDVGSAYKVGGKDVRARDVQMLFADAATGAHSPALVRQGQISELINAKPKSRRKVLEDAAGIGGLYQRRHEAELKLKGAEQNLARVDDVLEQLAGQLQSLARQARQAARYREIGELLRAAEGLLLYRRWREADDARQAAEDALRAATTAAAGAEGEARKAASARAEAEAALPPLREEDAIAAAVLQRLQVERDTLDADAARAVERIETLAARIEQLDRDIGREEALNADAGETIARLEWEAAEIAKASEGHEDKLARAAEEAQEAARILQAREEDLDRKTEDAARLAARHQSVQRLIDDSRKTRDRAEAARAAALAARDAALAAEAEAADAVARAQAEAAEAVAAAGQAETALAEAEAARAAIQGQEAEARAARAEAEGEAKALAAEVAALSKLVARETGTDAQIIDALGVEPGFEKALGAALADDLKAPAIGPDGISGWATLDPYAAPPALPEGVEPLAGHVTGPAALARRLGQIGVVAPEDGARLQPLLQPGQRLVSRAGDLWRWDGFRAGAEDAPSAAALRLEQINRLDALRRQLDEAEGAAAAARAAHDAIVARLADLTEADQAARAARREADKRVAETSRALSRAEADQALARGKAETAELAVSRHADELNAAALALAEAEASLKDLGDLDAARALVEDLRMTVEAARMTMVAKRSQHDELRREGEARLKRRQEITKEISGWRHRLETAGKRAAELAERKAATEAELAEARALPGTLEARRAELSGALAKAEARKAAAADALSVAEGALRDAAAAEREAERAASEAREARARAEARRDAAAEAVAQAADRISEALDLTPETLLQALDADPAKMPPAEEIEAKVAQYRRQRDALGAVNLRAEEDAREVQEEHDTLAREKQDLEGAIAKLRAGINALNKEGRERLLTAFEQVNTNFSRLFTHLFRGGEAKLVLVESDDPLEAGLEIMCQPPGKKLSTLSLLSGGEQTLTALALIFAVFLANPAPICVLDEVDAPLDDANVTRFCDLLDEMTRTTDTRFLIITHHAVTMARMDRLFGVTMAEQGVSQLVSVDLRAAEQMVA